MSNHHHHENETEDVYSMIKEPKEVVSNAYPKLAGIHCNGCQNNCPLTSPKCGRGDHIKEMLKKIYDCS